MTKAPFDFVLNNLFTLQPVVKPMFGCHAVYVGEKIVLILRQKKDHIDSNGIWIATDKSHHDYLKNIFSGLKSVPVLSGGKDSVTNWQMISEDDPEFESCADHLCELILQGDNAIGRIPAKKKKKIKLKVV